MRNSFIILFTLITFYTCVPLSAQDLEPRLLSAIPTGGNFAIASYGYSKGNILLDNSLPIEDLTATMNSFVAAYARSFSLFHKLAKFDLVIPYAFGEFEGLLSSIDTSTSRNGFGDPLVRISMLLIGAPPLGLADFAKHKQEKFNLGVFARIRAPLGQYDPTLLLNLGTNRWGIQLGLAGSYRFGEKIILEGHINSWFFTENDAFFDGNTLKQKPLVNLQMHLAYVFKPGIWVALSAGANGRGETILNGEPKNDQGKGARYGGFFAYRLSRHSALKAAVTSGLSTRYGSDFTTVLLAYQFIWFDKMNK